MSSVGQSGGDALARLAERCGIAAAYWDGCGQRSAGQARSARHAISDEARRALLAAMHFPASADPAAQLQELEERAWRRLLPPVQVLHSGDTPSVPLSLPARLARRAHRWQLSAEDGAAATGKFKPAALPLRSEQCFGGVDFLRAELTLPQLSTPGYYRLEVEPNEELEPTAMTLIVAPSACYAPAALQSGKRVWGPAVQACSLRSRRNWGIGDCGDLATLVDLSGTAGGGVVGVGSIHSLLIDAALPDKLDSRPSHRAFLNPLCLDVEAVPEFAECEAARTLVGSERFQGRLRRLRASDEVAWNEVWVVKSEALLLIYRHFRDRHLANDSPRARAFGRFCAERGEALQWHARFEALQQHFRRADPGLRSWRDWPLAYRHPQAPAVAAFAEEGAEDCAFHRWLQWLADEQLAGLGRQALQRGLGVGLAQALSAGVDANGSEAWAGQDLFADGASLGRPPDELNRCGADWGLLPFVPHRLRAAAYAPFIALLRANMRHSGAICLELATGLARAFWVPAGLSPAQGGAVAYPLAELLAIVALESHRQRCLVIGDGCDDFAEFDVFGERDEFFDCDARAGLGAELRARTASAGVLCCRSLLRERTPEGDFTAPADYPSQLAVAVGGFALPSVHDFWQGSDIETRAAQNLLASAAVHERLVVERAQDRARLLVALQREGLLPEGATAHPLALTELTLPYVVAIHTYLARTPAQLLWVQPENLLGVVGEAAGEGHGLRRLPLDIEEWREDGRFTAVAAALLSERGSAVARSDELPAARVAVIPRATYRLQFNREFTFAQAAALAPYLAELGISHCYASPYLRARPGSSHGYDIVDHAALNPEIGSAEEYEAFVGALKAHGLSQILDIVPNHMGVMGADNAWWLDVLENGQASAWGHFFDIDWEPLNPELAGKVLLPLLGDHYGRVLKRGELRLEYDAQRGEFSIFYYQHRLPVDPASYPSIIGHRSERLATILGKSNEHFGELQTLLTALAHLPARTDRQPERVAERQRDKEVHKRRLAGLCAACADIALHIADNLAEYNGHPDHPASFDLLHELIRIQAYRLAYWRVASDEINYRRFFDINELAALRMEDPSVFAATHRFVIELVAQGKVDGLRVDHPDGLYDPAQYFRRLQSAVGGGLPRAGRPLPIYLVIEKILAHHERLPDDWPVHGATGYRFANLVNNLFVDTAGERRMTRIYRDFTGIDSDFDSFAYQARKLIMWTALASEVNVLATRLARIAAASRDTCDFTLNGLRRALVEVLAAFPIYRTYVAGRPLSADDRRHIAWAVGVARRRSAAADIDIYDFIEGVLNTDLGSGRSAAYRESLLVFAMKFQQLSSPVMAKGIEDTAFYRYHRLISLNEVGGDPRRFGISVAAFHAAAKVRAANWPHNLLATSTHDSKRSEDTRARLNVLSEMPAAWKLMLKHWRRLNRGRKQLVDGCEAPSRNDEYLLYQTLIGTWPLSPPDAEALAEYRTRIESYMAKALREAKEHSSWVRINADYEAATSGFIQALLAPGEKNLFLADFVSRIQPVIRHGLINSLAQTLIKLVSPGVPDIYQGCELWQFKLVDPDNRRPVDYQQRRQLLAKVQALVAGPPAKWTQRLQVLLSDLSDGRCKLYLLWQALALRARWPDLFRDGDYLPVSVSGKNAAHVCAFARRHEDRAVIAVVPRLPAKLLGQRQGLPLGPEVWGETLLETPVALSKLGWQNIFTGERHPASSQLALSRLLASFPVALLACE